MSREAVVEVLIGLAYDKTFLYLCVICALVWFVTVLIDPIDGPRHIREPDEE